MLLKDKKQSKRTIKMDLNQFDKTLLKEVIGKKENDEKSYAFYQELLGHLWEIPPRYRHGKTFPYLKTINISIVEETFSLKIVLVKSVSTIHFCENYRQVLALKSTIKNKKSADFPIWLIVYVKYGHKGLKSVFHYW